jgi:hypothetical protein
MNSFLKNFMVCLAAASCLFGLACVPDPPIPRPEEPDPLVCDFGFDISAAQDTCECLAPKVRIAGIECREPNAEEFYASMEGCLVDIGIIFYYRDDSLRNNCCRRIYIERPSLTITRTQYDPGTMRHTTLPSGMDSVHMIGTGPYFAYSPDDESRPLDMRFTGIYTDENTIEGEFQWGLVLTDTIDFRYPGTFRRRPE